MSNGRELAVAKSDKMVYIWDVGKEKCVAKIQDHNGRVASLSWNDYVLTSGGFDGHVFNHDSRLIAWNHGKIGEFKFHEQDICGLVWSNNGQVLACGSEDTKVTLWDKSGIASSSSRPVQVFTDHKAAVKAIAWCPWHSNILATGGGKADSTIKLWNYYSGQCSKSLSTNTQVSGLLWSSLTRELISSHGEPLHELSIWKFPTLTKVGDMTGHKLRILSIVLSPNGEQVASLGADETLRFWNCFKSIGQSRNLSAISTTPVTHRHNFQSIR
jgi:cell division cycle protein 20 (cofactor of APC complex)